MASGPLPGGDSAISALASARSADLVVVRQPDRAANEDMATNIEALLFEGGRPVLFLPSDGKLATPIKRILIAWDGSREAARATHDALPLLKAAQAVEIVVVDAEKLPDIDAPLAAARTLPLVSRVMISTPMSQPSPRATARPPRRYPHRSQPPMLILL